MEHGVRSRHSWTRLPLAMGLAIAVLAIGCSRGGDTAAPTGDTSIGSADTTPDVVKSASTDKPKSGGKLVYGLEAETDGWNPTVNRWANIVLPGLYVVSIVASAIGETSAYYWFLSIAESVLLLLIVWYAWTWPRREGTP